jgi:hypothetical protein
MSNWPVGSPGLRILDVRWYWKLFRRVSVFVIGDAESCFLTGN